VYLRSGNLGYDCEATFIHQQMMFTSEFAAIGSLSAGMLVPRQVPVRLQRQRRFDSTCYLNSERPQQTYSER